MYKNISSHPIRPLVSYLAPRHERLDASGMISPSLSRVTMTQLGEEGGRRTGDQLANVWSTCSAPTPGPRPGRAGVKLEEHSSIQAGSWRPASHPFWPHAFCARPEQTPAQACRPASGVRRLHGCRRRASTQVCPARLEKNVNLFRVLT